MRPTSKSLLAGLFTSLFILLIVFLGLEVLLRTTHLFGARISWSNPDPVLGWKFTPSGHFWSQEENDHPVLWSTNRYGWKDKEWEIAKKPGYRVAVLGDSYAEALQVEPAKNAISLTEKFLNDSGVTTEWMNFGRAGFTQTEEYAILEKDVFPFQPDLLVLFFYPVNDIEDIAPETTTDPVRPYYKLENGSLVFDTSFNQGRSFALKSFLSGLKQKSALISLITQRFSLLQRRTLVKKLQIERQQRSAGLQGYMSLATAHPDPVFEKNYALNKLLIEKIAQAAQEHGADLMLVLIDLPVYRPEVEKEYKEKDATFDPLFFEKDLSEFSQSKGIKFLNLTPAFRESYLKNNNRALHWDYWKKQVRADSWEYAAHTGHWNYEGHELAARTLAEAFTAWQRGRKV